MDLFTSWLCGGAFILSENRKDFNLKFLSHTTGMWDFSFQLPAMALMSIHIIWPFNCFELLLNILAIFHIKNIFQDHMLVPSILWFWKGYFFNLHNTLYLERWIHGSFQQLHYDFNVIMGVNVMPCLTGVPKNLVCELDCWGYLYYWRSTHGIKKALAASV